MPKFTSPSIAYYRINANNTGIAQSNLGTGTPTEPIEPPLQSGKFSAYDPALKKVTGVSSQFQTLWKPNMYVYYNDAATGDFKLVGQIASFVDNLNLILTTDPINSTWIAGTSNLYASYSLITTGESIYMRIQTVGPPFAPNGKKYIPDFGLDKWRIGNGLTGLNKDTQSYIEQVSIIGTPLSNAATLTKISFTFETINQFTVASSVDVTTKYWLDSGSLPQFVWIKVTPQIGSSTSFNSQTLYRFVTQEYMDGIEVGAQTLGSDLQNAGYNNISTGVDAGNNQPGQN
jgi:hypothetical protein